MGCRLGLLLLLVLVSESALVMAQKQKKLLSNCEIVYVSFPHCLDFLMGLFDDPSGKCCNHIKKLNMIAKHRKGNARRFCYCIEDIVRDTHPPLLASRIQDLPVKCNTHLSFPISMDMDCSKVTD